MATESSTHPGYVSVKNDGFEIRSNVGTADDLRADLGIEEAPEPKEVATKEEPRPAKKAARENPDARRASIQAEIDAETERKRKAKEEADAEEARLTTLRRERESLAQPRREQPIEQPRAAAQPKRDDYDGSDADDPAPTLEQFKDKEDPYTEWMLARSAHAARVEWRKQNHAQEQRSARTRDEQIYDARIARLRENIGKHEAGDPDWRKRVDPEVASALTWTTPDGPGTPLGDLVMDADNPAELMMHFSGNKAEFRRIMALHPLRQAHELGMIQGRLSAAATRSNGNGAKPKPVSQAKPPITPLGGSGMTADDDRPDEELSDEEHESRYAKYRMPMR